MWKATQRCQEKAAAYCASLGEHMDEESVIPSARNGVGCRDCEWETQSPTPGPLPAGAAISRLPQEPVGTPASPRLTLHLLQQRWSELSLGTHGPQTEALRIPSTLTLH